MGVPYLIVKVCLELLDRRAVPMRDRVDEGVEVEGGQVRVVRVDVHNVGVVVPRQVHVARLAVVQVRERNLVLGADLVPDDNLQRKTGDTFHG